MIRPVRRALGAAVSAMLVAGVLLAAAPAGAAQAPARCRQPSLHQQVKQADVVFRGVVDKVRPVKGKGAGRTRTYKVEVDRIYKSSLVSTSVVVTAEVGVTCPPPTLARGKRYIFFVTENGSRLMATPATARATKKLTAQVVAKLGSGALKKTSSADAEFTTVAGADPPALSRLLAPGAALLIISLLGLLVVGRLGRRAT